jgi:hypothetical protein
VNGQLAGLASFPWSFRPAGGRALANFDQLPQRGLWTERGGRVHLGGRIGRNAPWLSRSYESCANESCANESLQVVRLGGTPPDA